MNSTSVSEAYTNVKVSSPGTSSTAVYLVRMCASGKHIANAVLTSRTERFELTDIMITSCAFTGDQRKHEFTGHVTLMK